MALVNESDVRSRASQSAVDRGLSTVGARVRLLGVKRSLAGMLAVAGVGALAIVVGRGVVPAPAPQGAAVAPAPRARGATPATTAPGGARERPAVPLRNPFRYADDARAGLGRQLGSIATAPAPAVSTPLEIRFLGLVRRGGTLKAALAISGDVFLVAPGEEVAGYVLLSLDEETVKVRGTDGKELDLRLAP